MPKIDDFVYVLIAAVIFMAFFAFAGFLGPWLVPANNVTVTSFDVGEVGYVTNYASRTVDLRTFTVGENQTESLVSSPQLEITQGWFGGKQETLAVVVPDYYLETARGVSISFDVYDTNQYGKLVFKWNGVVLNAETYEKGYHSFLIKAEDVKPSNTLTVYTEGPGMMFWAATVYQLKNFNVNLEYGPERVIPFQMMPSEMQGFDRIETSFFASGTGTLEVMVNGVSVFSGAPKGQSTVKFNIYDAPVRAGENVITFISRDGPYTLQDTEMRVFLSTGVAASKHFNLTDEHYNLLSGGLKGRINYFVDTIANRGSLEIKLNGNQIPVTTPQVGWNTATFTVSEAVKGDNTITFSGTGDYEISQANIMLER